MFWIRIQLDMKFLPGSGIRSGSCKNERAGTKFNLIFISFSAWIELLHMPEVEKEKIYFQKVGRGGIVDPCVSVLCWLIPPFRTYSIQNRENYEKCQKNRWFNATLFIPTWEARQIANNYNTDPNFAPTFSHLRTNVVPPFLRHNMCNYVKTSLLLLSVLLPTSQGGKVSDNSVNLVEKGSLTLSLSLLFYYYHWINIYIYVWGEERG